MNYIDFACFANKMVSNGNASINDDIYVVVDGNPVKVESVICCARNDDPDSRFELYLEEKENE